jgi:adenylate cyclase
MSKHKERWRETELQLRDTRENLERVDGIRRELEKRISELEESETSQPQTFETSEPRQSPAGALHAVPTQPPPATGTRESAMSETGPLRLTIDQVPFPAYMLNYNLELTWYNEEARVLLLGSFDRLPANTKERGVFEFFSRGTYGKSLENCEAFRQLHNQMGRKRVAAALGNASMGVTGRVPGVSGSDASPIAELPLNLRTVDGGDEYYRILVSYFREGILVIFTDEEAGHHGLLGLLERRDEVIRNLLKKRLPVLTDVAVMVADLQNSVRICSELPPEEYFELINQIWSTMEPIFRNYYGTHGKHVGDGMMYYFFPQPDCNYIFNAVRCTSEMREAMRKISKEWQLRKNWLNELYLNTGLNEGQEWLGVFHVETKVEFSVLGDTINHAARLSDFARHGSIWATKNLLGKLTSEERKRVRFGVKRQDLEGREVFVNASYSRLSELVDLASPRYEKLCDIAALAVTEIVEVE